jgi:polar amino acid transport system substrate-binding protein/arginine/ornithine transport system substrate-binding protein
MNRILTTIAAAAVLASAWTLPAAAGEKLRIGVEGAYPPFSWKEPDGTLKGFDIDIALALCEKMDRECELVEQDWDGIIPALLARKYDAIVASMSITEERKKRVDFSDKYYNTPNRFVAAKGASFEATAEGLKGKSIGVQRGTVHQCFLEKMFPDADLKLYATQEEVFLDLNSGRIDAQMSDSIQADEGFLSKPEGEGFAYLGGDMFDQECHGDGAGIAVRKDDEELRDAFSAAIKTIREDGTYAKINGKYFDFDVYGETIPAS